MALTNKPNKIWPTLTLNEQHLLEQIAIRWAAAGFSDTNLSE
jgi:hypothetical protein